MRRIMLSESKIAKAKALCPVATTSEKSGFTSMVTQRYKAGQNSETFEQRKAMKTEYVELFKALFKISDKQVQQRVMDAINGVKAKEHGCDECRKRLVVKRETKNIATQTEMDDSMQNNYSFNQHHTNLTRSCNIKDCHCSVSIIKRESNSKSQLGDPVSIIKSESNSKSQLGEMPPLLTNPITLGANHEELEERKEKPSLPVDGRKRRRKTCLPRVIKQSQVQLHQQEIPLLNPTITNELINPIVNVQTSANAVAPCIPNDNFRPAKRQRFDSSDSLSLDFHVDFNLWEFSDLFQNIDIPPKPFTEQILLNNMFTVMEKEYRESEKSDPDDSLGYLPIHDALYESDLERLCRQIYVWKKLKNTPLNEVVTEYGKDCMEVALSHNSKRKAIEILINDGYNINCWYEDAGTVLHLAILNEVDLETLKLLARKVEFDVMHKRNDDGYTPLFLALRKNNYLYLEVLLQIIDERLDLKSHHRPAALNDSEKDNLEEFTQFYALQCKNIEDSESPDFESAPYLKKQRILNEPDAKSGNTMLLFAIEQHLEHFIYMLLANFADPLVQNYSGYDARSFYNQYGKSVQFNLKVDKYLENVETVLH